MKIGVIGLGVVGSAVAHGLERIGNDVYGYDLKMPETSIDGVLSSEVCFICVPTKTDDAGVCDTSIVEGVVAELAARKYGGVATIKSTVTPGTTDRLAAEHPGLRLAFCPEFLRERAAFTDFFENHDVCAIGTNDDASYEAIRLAHGNIPKAFARLSPVEAELVKYFSNVFNALRITFANEFYEVATALGADYTKVKNAVVKRANIPDEYLDCNERFRGFGGVCLPKDTLAFATLVDNLGLERFELFRTIVEENKKFSVTVPEGMRAR